MEAEATATPPLKKAGNSVNPAAVKAAVVAGALREWNRWNKGTLNENDASMRSVLTGYWNSTPGGSNILSKPDWWNKYAWSAAFICYVVRNAGAGPAFRYSSYHTTYTFYAKQNRLQGIPDTFKAYRITERKPQLGDIIVQNYDGSGRNYDTVKPNEGGAHGDIVIDVSATQVKVIGGNVNNSVTQRQYPLNGSGFLKAGRHWAIVTFGNDAAVTGEVAKTVAAGAAGGTTGAAAGACVIPVMVPPDIAKSVVKQGRGFKAYGGGRLSTILDAMNKCGKLAISADEIDTFQRMANVETGGLVHAVNSWDSAYMSAGFMQLTAKYGELQRLIQQAPAAFSRYGIALDNTNYTFGQAKIKGTANANELRSRDWAERFFRAGLDTDVIAAQVIRGRAIMQAVLAATGRWLGAGFPYFNAFYSGSSAVRALVQETHNNRPAYLRRALVEAVREARRKKITQLDPFLALLRNKIRSVYEANAARENDTPQHMRQKADHIIVRTANP